MSEAGPPFRRETGKTVAAASQEHCSKKEKLIVEEELMYRCGVSVVVYGLGADIRLKSLPSVLAGCQYVLLLRPLV
jgi:hypothetical protein